MRIASLSIVGLLVGACFDPTRVPGGADAESGAAPGETGSSDADGSSSASSSAALPDETGSTDDESSSTGVSLESSSSETGEDPYAQWPFHREVWVANAGAPRVGYQVELQLPRDDPFMPGGSDIRVVDDDGTELPIWFDDPGVGDHASIWVKLDLGEATERRLMIHYGYEDAPSVQDAAAVFELYDDFAVLDGEAWTSTLGEWMVDDGLIATDVDEATSTWSSEAPMIVEALLLWQGGGIEPSSGIALDSGFGPLGVVGMPLTVLTATSPLEIPGPDIGTWMRVRIERDEYVQIHIAIDGNLLGTWDAPIDGPYRIHLGRIHGQLESFDLVVIDWLFVRQGGSPPDVSVGPMTT